MTRPIHYRVRQLLPDLAPVATRPRPDSHTRPYIPLAQPGVLIAERARTLIRHAGPCRRCGRALLSGERVADLAGGGGTVHVAGCSAASAS